MLARPRDGTALVLGPTAAVVWSALEGWTTPSTLDAALGDVFPEVSAAERSAALDEILTLLEGEALLERRPA